MEAAIIEKLGSYGLGVIFSLALLQIIKEQMKDLRQRVETQAHLSLRNDQQLTRQIYLHGERLKKVEDSVNDLNNIMNLRRKRDYKD